MPNVVAHAANRRTPGELERAIGDGVDVLVDIIAFERADAEQLNKLAGRIGSVVLISSASVYVDERGRSLDEAISLDTFPDFGGPIRETTRTVEPSDATYSTNKMAVERTLRAGPLPVTILRPAAIHGPGSQLPRELYFVKRIVDGRHSVVLVHDGASRFQTTSVENLAALVRLAAEQPGMRVLNCGDPNPPTVSEIGTMISAHLRHPLRQVLIADSSYERTEFANPWAVPRPFVLDMDYAQQELQYQPVVTYEQAVGATCDWLVQEMPNRDWSNTYLGQCFDYTAEDELLNRGTFPT